MEKTESEIIKNLVYLIESKVKRELTKEEKLQILKSWEKFKESLDKTTGVIKLSKQNVITQDKTRATVSVEDLGAIPKADVPEHVVTDEYDGITEGLTDEGDKITIYDLKKALDQESPRSVFLNGQLYIEKECDMIIGIYFAQNNPIKMGVLGGFLTSRYCDFFDKIFILKNLVTNSFEPIIKDSKIISSLQAIGEVRNSFQHNIEYVEAMDQVRKGGKFSFVDKNLKGYSTVENLLEDFKTEVIEVYHKLNDLEIS